MLRTRLTTCSVSQSSEWRVAGEWLTCGVAAFPGAQATREGCAAPHSRHLAEARSRVYNSVHCALLLCLSNLIAPLRRRGPLPSSLPRSLLPHVEQLAQRDPSHPLSSSDSPASRVAYASASSPTHLRQLVRHLPIHAIIEPTRTHLRH